MTRRTGQGVGGAVQRSLRWVEVHAGANGGSEGRVAALRCTGKNCALVSVKVYGKGMRVVMVRRCCWDFFMYDRGSWSKATKMITN